MTISIAHLGPKGTFSEFAAATYAEAFDTQPTVLQAYPTIAQAIYSTAKNQSDFCVVPIENSIGGGVTFTLDALWEVETLQIQQAFTLPVQHALISRADSLNDIQKVYSHPQALSQCRQWLENNLPGVDLVRASSTAEPLPHIQENVTAGAIASSWGAKIYDLPILAYPINDFADNYTRFWVLGQKPSTATAPQESKQYTSLAFSLGSNEPGALLKPLQLFSVLNINMSRIESRPTKRLLGDYIFFVDVEASAEEQPLKTALELLKTHTDTLKIFGSYSLTEIKQVP
ncbi:MAG: prephenate dehydratase [Phormidesmis sp. RL_2_1]|nr:prephenate dehydratase [Phormidesmis sp. RL_2_1]